MHKQIYIIAIVTGLLFLSCNQEKKQNYSDVTKIATQAPTTNDSIHPGKKLLETKCYVCHNPSGSHDARIAPPMVAVKSHYLDDDTTKEEFADALWNFVKKPSEAKTKMRGAVRRFGVMPYQVFSEEEIRLISEYIYDYKIDEPEWFKQHIEEESKGKMKYRNKGKAAIPTPSSTSENLSERGMQYALNTKKELGKNLMGTIQKKGTKAAVTFCSEKAYPITDSMAKAQNVSIKRVSDRPRNPKNIANAKELDLIDFFKKAIANKEDYQPVTEENNGEVTFYAPITTNSMCLQCHGTPTQNITPEVLKTITSLYPKDKATGYNINEVRGMWRVTFKK